MIVYRLSSCKYIDDLSGEGAFRSGGRWNSKGIHMLYTSTSISLCTLEILVHTDGIPTKNKFCLLTLEIPDKLIKELSKEKLSKDWDSLPPNGGTKEIGDQFIKLEESLSLKVPSAVVPQEYNIIINPNHPLLSKIEIISKRPFLMDSRLK